MKRKYKGAIVDERQWIHAIRKGNREALGDIAEKYYDDIYRFCAFQTGSREDAYDLAQETFFRFIKYVEGYHDRNLKGYLLTIAMNVCRNYLQRKGKETRRNTALNTVQGQNMESGDSWGQSTGWDQAAEQDAGGIYTQFTDKGWQLSDPERHVVDADIHNRLMLALAQLPQMQREAILLHYLYDMKYREIGKAMGCQTSTVKSRVRQGMEKLQALLYREDFLD